MSIGNEVDALRYYLRDPDSKLWDNELLFGLYNQAQNEMQQRTGLLEGVTAIEVPPEFSYSYMYDWEAGMLPGNGYQCLRTQGNNFTTCFRWEVQQNYGLATPDVQEEGYAYTHPWEAFVGVTPNKPPAFAFPDDFHSVKQMFFDQEPVLAESSKTMMRTDPSWTTRSGNPLRYYVDDVVENQFKLPVRPSSITWGDQTGSGMVTSVSGDTTNEEVGFITISTTRYLSADQGVAIDVISSTDNITLLYDVQPPDIDGLSDQTYVPDYLQKYIRYRVLELAYGANTDGRNRGLEDYWGQRARLGLNALKVFRSNRYKDRDYQMTTRSGSRSRNLRHARLPDAYPNINP